MLHSFNQAHTAHKFNQKSINDDHEMKYPTPATTGPSSPLLAGTAFSRPSKKVSKRKSQPHRSISKIETDDEKFLAGVIKLEVYELYHINPTLLLSNPSPKPKKKPANSKIEITGLTSEEQKVSIDMSMYRNTKGAPSVIWKKGGMLEISPNEEMYELLTVEELKLSSTLRVLPSQYMHIKETMLSQVKRRGAFKKRDAKSWFRIDVNKVFRKLTKTAILYDWFKGLGWIPSESSP